MITIANIPPGDLDADEGPTPRAVAGIRQLLDALEYQPSRPRVFIKPNIVDAVPAHAAVTTDPALVEALALALVARADAAGPARPIEELVIGDGSGYFSNDERLFDLLVERSGYGAMIARLRDRVPVPVRLVNLEWEERVPVPWAHGTLELPRLCQTHAYVNFARMKTHIHTLVTLCTKNQKGLLLLTDKKAFHLTALHERIRALAGCVQPDLALIDATRALEGTGPFSATFNQTHVRALGLCLAGRDQAEVDAAGCRVMGIDPAEVAHLETSPMPPTVTFAPDSAPLAPADPPFQRPDPYLQAKVGNIYRIITEHACTNCQMATGRLLNKITRAPEFKEAVRAFVTRHPKVYLVLGRRDPAGIPTDGPVVCFGDCTKALAKKIDAVHVPGCPPDYNAAIPVLLGTDPPVESDSGGH